MALHSPIHLAADISSHLIGNDLLLFSENQQRMFKLNTTAAFIWYCLEEQQEASDIIKSLIETFHIEKKTAQMDLQNALNEWESSGLLIQNAGSAAQPLIYNEEKLPPVEYPFPVPSLDNNHVTRYYQLIDCRFCVRYDNEEILNKIHPNIRHLEKINSTIHDVNFDIVQSNNDFILLLDGKVLDYCAGKIGLAPMMHANMIMIAYSRTDCLLAIHAGAVAKDSECILLPALSGSGKSTLTAALLNEGYIYCSDDLALLSYNTHEIRPVPVSIGLKEGAWPILNSRFPKIKELETHLRGDEKLVRYLPPPSSSLAPDLTKGYPVRYILFPRYQASSNGSITPISAADALCRLTEAGYDTHRRLDSNSIDKMIHWIDNIECYSLEYDQLSDAIQLIKNLWK